MGRKVEILTGNIGKNLFKLALPIMLTSLVSILYNLTDIKFISAYLGDDAVSSAAAASFFIVFSAAFLIIPKNGAQILVAQSIGAKFYKKARAYARISLIITTGFSIFTFVIIQLFAKELIALVGISKENYLNAAIAFLKVCSFGFPFLFLSNTLSAIISADGDTFGPFMFNSLGVGINILLDYVFLAILKFDIKGAAIATVMSQFIAFLCMYIYFRSPKSRFRKMKIFKLDKPKMYIKLIKIGVPSGLSQALFTGISIVIAKMIANFDESVLGVQRLGVQFESFSWNISGGVSSAVATYVAQNYGAKQFERVKQVYFISLRAITIFGFLITMVFILFAKPLYASFFQDEKLINHGISYLRIIGLTQIFQCVDIITTGAFNGIGKINEPNIIGIVGTGARIPFAYFLAPIFGITAIWWVISASMFIKGLVSLVWFVVLWSKVEKRKEVNI